MVGNVNTSSDVLTKLAKGENEYICKYAKRNPNFVENSIQDTPCVGIAGMKKEAIKKVAESTVKNQSVPKKDLSR